jgi:hypothetical protein
MDASEAERQKIIRALEAGRVVIDPGAAEAIGRMDLHNPDFTPIRTTIEFWGPWRKGERGNDGGLVIQWETVSAGCGRLAVRLKDGELQCDNQGMGKVFILSLFEHLIEQMELEDA